MGSNRRLLGAIEAARRNWRFDHVTERLGCNDATLIRPEDVPSRYAPFHAPGMGESMGEPLPVTATGNGKHSGVANAEGARGDPGFRERETTYRSFHWNSRCSTEALVLLMPVGETYELDDETDDERCIP
jgi:hypothetical protein